MPKQAYCSGQIHSNGGSNGSPTVAHGVVYVTSYNGTLYAFNAQKMPSMPEPEYYSGMLE
jgi:outer membrane protein assembly factor BamB